MFRFKEILGYISSYHPIPALISFYFIGEGVQSDCWALENVLFALYTKAFDQGGYTFFFFYC